jgi:putative membrane protein
MGVADVIPGMSGGSVAFITGIYVEMVHALRSIDREAFELLTKKRFEDFWNKINGNFLVAVFAGIVTSLLTIARLMTYLQTKYPILVWSFVFGLILISALLVLRDIKKWNIGIVVAFFFGALAVWDYLVVACSNTGVDMVHFSDRPVVGVGIAYSGIVGSLYTVASWQIPIYGQCFD